MDYEFVWLSVVSQGCHINVLHAGGVWTTQVTELVVMTDPTIVYILWCFLSTLGMYLSDSTKDLSMDSEYITPFLSVLETECFYIMVPRVLNDPIHNLASHLDEARLCAHPPTKPLQELLSDSLQCSVEEYHKIMVDWLGHEAANVPIIKKWLAVHGLILVDYLTYLRSIGTLDRLELWAFSLATNKAVTIVQESSVWSTSVQGTDF